MSALGLSSRKFKKKKKKECVQFKFKKNNKEHTCNIICFLK